MTSTELTSKPLDELGAADYVIVEFPAGQSKLQREVAKDRRRGR
jgi:hypothetical protein